MPNKVAKRGQNLPDKPEGYDRLLADLRSLIDRGLSHAYQAVDNIKVQTYWQIGERVAREEMRQGDRAQYGEKVVPLLADDLGLERSLLYRVIQLYRAYPIVAAVSRQLSWSHYVELLALDSEPERTYYERSAISQAWSTRELRERIKRGEYHLSAPRPDHLPPPPTGEALEPAKAFRNVYHWDFADLESAHSEGELEEALERQVTKTLAEFGRDFLFAGRQVKLLIDQEWHTVDLLFYHRSIPCWVLVELKARKFHKEDVGQMNAYLECFKHQVPALPWERPPIGLIVCQEAGRETVRYALGGLEEKIFVAEYRTKLPDERQLADKLQL